MPTDALKVFVVILSATVEPAQIFCDTETASCLDSLCSTSFSKVIYMESGGRLTVKQEGEE